MKRYGAFAAAALALGALAPAAAAFPAAPMAGEPRSHAGSRTKGTELVGHVPLRGFNGDVWYHRDTVYVGGWGRTADHCPTHGVRVVDVADPAKPAVLARFGRFAGTTSEDVWVGEVSTASFSGDLAVVGIQLCDASAAGVASGTFRGLAIYDVTNPTQPELLSRLSTGARTLGTHELSAVQREDGKVLVLSSAPRSYEMNNGALGDARIIDVTNPRRPTEVLDWHMARNGPQGDAAGLMKARGIEQLFVHSAWPFADGTKLFLSHWDAGAVFMDISNPAKPRYLGRTSYHAHHEGDAHSGSFTQDEKIFIQNDECFFQSPAFPMFNRQKAWGYQRIFDVSKLGQPREIARFATENALSGARDGFYSVHNNQIVGDIEYVSAYSDGVRIVDIANPARPVEIGFFVPPPHRDPERFIVAPNGNRELTLVWGVAVGDDPNVVYASDVNSGLWIFRVLAS